MHFRGYGGVLVAAFRLVLLQDVLGALDPVLVVLLLHAEADLSLLEAIENLGYADGLVALVLDGADDGAFGHHETDDPPELSRFPFQTDVVELAGVPQDHEIAAQDVFIVLIALLGYDLLAQRILRNAPRTPEIDRLDVVLGWRTGRRRTRRGARRLLRSRRLLQPGR